MKKQIKKSIFLTLAAIASTSIVATIAAACTANSKYSLKPYSESFVSNENNKIFIKMQTNLEQEALKDLVFNVTVNQSKNVVKAYDIKKENNIFIFKLEISNLEKNKDNVIVITDNKKTFNPTTVKITSSNLKDQDSSLKDKDSSTQPSSESKDQNSGGSNQNVGSSGNDNNSETTTKSDVDPNTDASNQNPPASGTENKETADATTNPPATNTSNSAGGSNGATSPESGSSPETTPPKESQDQGVESSGNQVTPSKPAAQKLTINLETDEGYLKEENSGQPSPDKKSPAISWSPVEGAVSYAVVMIDYEATVITQSMPFVHWMVANIKGTNLPSIPITQKHDNTVTGSSFIPSENPSTRQAIYYYPATPPNGIHNYEIKVFALSKEIDSASVVEVNNQVTYNKIEKAIFEAGVIDYDVKYVLGRQINWENGELLPKASSLTNRLFKDDQKTIIDQIDLTNINDFKVTLTQDQDVLLSSAEPAFTFNDTNSNAKSYLVMLTSTNSTQNQDVDQGTIHYAAIVSKDKTKKHIFNNAYASRFYQDKYQYITKDGVPVINQIKGNKMAILENEQASSLGVYTITVMGIDEEFDTLLNNVNNIKNKYASQSEGHGGNSEDYNTVTNAFESIRNKVVSYGTTYKN